MGYSLGACAATTFSHYPGIRAANAPEYAKDIKVKYACVEAMNILGYFPGIATIVGIARIIFALIKFEDDMRSMQCLRGALEILGFGFVMIISDPIVTIIAKKELDRVSQCVIL